MNDFSRGLLVALRRLAADPAFSLFSIVTLALGIGATTAIYSIIYAAVLRPLDIRDIDRVVNVYHHDPAEAPAAAFSRLSSPDYEDLRAMQTVFSEVTAWARFRETMVGGGMASVIFGEMVGGEYFHLLGVDAAVGRVLQPADDRPEAPPVVVLGDTLWRKQFGADAGIVGRTVQMGGHMFEVVGVAPAAFRGVDMPNVMPTAAWIPLAAAPLLAGTSRANRATDRDARWLLVKARLRPGPTVADAAAEVTSIGRRLDLAYPLGQDLPPAYRRQGPAVERAWHVMPAGNLRMHESVHRLTAPLASSVMAAVGLVLLVACTNLANLLLARGASRRQETAVRLALGASRARLIGEFLIEAALVAAAGGVAALVVARVLMVSVLNASMRLAPAATIQVSPELHLSVVGVAAAATLLALVVFGLIPALHLSRTSVRDALSTDSVAGGPLRWRGRRSLIACQVGVSVALVAVAAVATDQVRSVARRETGLDLERLALVRLDFQMQQRSEVQARQTLEAIAAGARRLPGVESVALSSGLPVGTGTPGAVLFAGAGPASDGTAAELLSSTLEIFRTLGVPVTRGRAFDDRDAPAALPVAVLSETAARALFGTTEVVGREVLVQRRRWEGEQERPVVTRTVVGVAGDTDTGSVGRRRHGTIYVPFWQHYEPAMTVIGRTSGDPAALASALRTLANRLDPELAIFDAGTGTGLGGAENVPVAIVAGAAGLLGLLALVLAMAGLYGVLSHVIAGRTREIGLRMALGASRRRVVRMVLADGVRPVAEGLILGLGAGIIVRLALRPVFVRLVPALDPLSLLAVPILFVAAGLLACYFPARRAARVDPNVALRHL